MGLPCLRVVEEGCLAYRLLFLAEWRWMGPVFCHRLQDPDYRGLMVMAPAFVKRRRWLTAMIQEAGRTLSGDSERQPLQVAWSHLRTTLLENISPETSTRAAKAHSWPLASTRWISKKKL